MSKKILKKIFLSQFFDNFRQKQNYILYITKFHNKLTIQPTLNSSTIVLSTQQIDRYDSIVFTNKY